MGVPDVVPTLLSIVVAFFIGIWRGVLTYADERIPLDFKDIFTAVAISAFAGMVFVLFPSVQRLELYLRILYTAVFVPAFFLIGFLGYGIGRIRLKMPEGKSLKNEKRD